MFTTEQRKTFYTVLLAMITRALDDDSKLFHEEFLGVGFCHIIQDSRELQTALGKTIWKDLYREKFVPNASYDPYLDKLKSLPELYQQFPASFDSEEAGYVARTDYGGWLIRQNMVKAALNQML